MAVSKSIDLDKKPKGEDVKQKLFEAARAKQADNSIFPKGLTWQDYEYDVKQTGEDKFMVRVQQRGGPGTSTIDAFALGGWDLKRLLMGVAASPDLKDIAAGKKARDEDWDAEQDYQKANPKYYDVRKETWEDEHDRAVRIQARTERLGKAKQLLEEAAEAAEAAMGHEGPPGLDGYRKDGKKKKVSSSQRKLARERENEANKKLKEYVSGLDKEERKLFEASVRDGAVLQKVRTLKRRQTLLNALPRNVAGGMLAHMDESGTGSSSEDDAVSESSGGKAASGDERALRATASALDAFDHSYSSWDAVARIDGLSEQGVNRMRAAGITLEGLKAGQYSEAQLLRIPYIKKTKVDALRRAGFNIPRSGGLEKEKRTVSYRPQTKDPFTVEANRGFFNRRAAVRNNNGGIGVTRVRGKASIWWEEQRDKLSRVKDFLKEPFEKSEAQKRVAEAKRIAELRRAEVTLERTKTARTAFLARLAITRHQFGSTGFALLSMAAVMAVVFFPWGFFQYVAYFMYGLLTFMFNGGYVLAINGIGLGVNMVLAVFNAVGLAATAGVQRLLDYVAVGLAGGMSGDPEVASRFGEYLVLQSPFQLQNVTLYNTQLLDPRLFNPQHFSANSIGSILFDWTGSLLQLTAGGWDASKTAIGSRCSANGGAWYECVLPQTWEFLWNGLMRFGEFLGTQVAGFFHATADLVRTGNQRIVHNPLFDGLTNLITGGPVSVTSQSAPASNVGGT